MAVYLVQHGKSLPEEKDPEKGLSEQGVNDVERMAKLASESGIIPTFIQHSGKKRARQTAEIFSAVLHPVKGVVEISGLNPLDDVRAFAESLESRENIMYVGHLPFMERLTSYLICGDEENPVVKFRNSGIVCIDNDKDKGKWVIRWMLMPDMR